jgi:hypothetical protein
MPAARVSVYWLPLGAGGHVVRWNGRLYETIAARREHRPAADLYHCALEVIVDGDSSVIEMAPVWATHAADRGGWQAGLVLAERRRFRARRAAASDRDGRPS